MEITFTKVDDKRYTVAIERRLRPPLVPRFGQLGRADMERSERLSASP